MHGFHTTSLVHFKETYVSEERLTVMPERHAVGTEVMKRGETPTSLIIL